jgi:hypothetical protein
MYSSNKELVEMINKELNWMNKKGFNNSTGTLTELPT